VRRLALAAATAAAVAVAPSPAFARDVCAFPIQRTHPAHVPRGTDPPLAIGDSTMVYAARYLPHWGFESNARLCRSFEEGLRMIRQRRDAHRLPDFVVLALGATGAVTDADVAEALRILGPRRVLGLTTHRFFLGQPGKDTDTIRRVARKHPRRIRLIDWVAYAQPHPSWFSFDGLHPNLVGAREFAKLIGRAGRVVERSLRRAAHRQS
jgi:hypothetical protein